MTEYEPPLILEQAAVPTRASVIWLHGLGASGHDFEPLIPELGLLEQGVRFILPHAPDQPVTVNGGYSMPAWYDIRRPEIDREVDEAGIRRSVTYLNSLIAEEQARGIAAESIIVAGFSQGGVIALHAGLTYASPLAGILALSTYLALPTALASEMPEANRKVPILIAHGTDDPVVPCSLAEAAHRQLKSLGCQVDFFSYAMPHTVCLDEVTDIRRWLLQRLSSSGPL